MAFPAELKTGGKIMVNANVATNQTSDIVVCERGTQVSFDVFLDNNNAVGIIEIQGCNDITRTTPNWVSITLSDGTSNVAVSSGTDVNALIDFADLGCKYVRVKYTVTSGDGTMSVACHVK